MKTLGPANDNDPNVQIEIRAARAADCDEAWESYEWVEECHAGWPWDPTRPLCEQEPWAAASIAALESDPGNQRLIQAIKDIGLDAAVESSAEALIETVEERLSDDPDPATKFGELANQVVVPVECTAPHDGECAPAQWGDGPRVCVIPLRAKTEES